MVSLPDPEQAAQEPNKPTSTKCNDRFRSTSYPDLTDRINKRSKVRDVKITDDEVNKPQKKADPSNKKVREKSIDKYRPKFTNNMQVLKLDQTDSLDGKYSGTNLMEDRMDKNNPQEALRQLDALARALSSNLRTSTAAANPMPMSDPAGKYDRGAEGPSGSFSQYFTGDNGPVTGELNNQLQQAHKDTPAYNQRGTDGNAVAPYLQGGYGPEMQLDEGMKKMSRQQIADMAKTAHDIYETLSGYLYSKETLASDITKAIENAQEKAKTASDGLTIPKLTEELVVALRGRVRLAALDDMGAGPDPDLGVGEPPAIGGEGEQTLEEKVDEMLSLLHQLIEDEDEEKDELDDIEDDENEIEGEEDEELTDLEDEEIGEGEDEETPALDGEEMTAGTKQGCDDVKPKGKKGKKGKIPPQFLKNIKKKGGKTAAAAESVPEVDGAPATDNIKADVESAASDKGDVPPTKSANDLAGKYIAISKIVTAFNQVYGKMNSEQERSYITKLAAFDMDQLIAEAKHISKTYKDKQEFAPSEPSDKTASDQTDSHLFSEGSFGPSIGPLILNRAAVSKKDAKSHNFADFS
jgi:hypothetical protein